MRVAGYVLAGLMIAMGAVWILQGVGILPGSFMTGQTIWASRGAATAIAGVVLMLLMNRKRLR